MKHGLAEHADATHEEEMEEHKHHEHVDCCDPTAGGHGHEGHGGHGDHAAMFRNKFWISLALTIPTVFYSHMLQNLLGYEAPMFRFSHWVAPAFGLATFLYGGRVFLTSGLAEIKAKKPGMMLLISMGLIVALLSSIATTLKLIDVDLWFELATLVTIMLLGHWIEMRAVGQTQDALGVLAKLLPEKAEKLVGNEIISVQISDLALGDVVLIRAGGRVPADGVITEGAAELDESMLTGESKVIPKSVGDKVVAGTVVADSAIHVRVSAVGDDTALAGISRLVEQAQQSHSRAQALADRFAALLFYVAMLAGFLTLVIWSAIGNASQGIESTVTVLIIACPHALGLAIPLTISVSTGMAARKGILVKDRMALEKMRTIDTVLFDKTGTLTKGEHSVLEVATVSLSEDEFLQIAASVENDSEHPLAKAIVKKVEEPNSSHKKLHASHFVSIPGRGVSADVNGQTYSIGGPALLRESNVEVPTELEAKVRVERSRFFNIVCNQ